MGRYRAGTAHHQGATGLEGSTKFSDFDEFERLVAAANTTDARAYVLVMLAAEAGLRLGEMVALEWRDIDFAKGQLCVERSAWKGQVASPKGGRLRRAPRADDGAARRHPSGPSPSSGASRAVSGRRLTVDRGLGSRPRSAGGAASWTPEQRAAHAASHVLLALGNAWSACTRDPGAGGTRRPDDDATLHALESGSD